MADGVGTELDEIGFVEFTSALITGVFDTVIAANLDQTETYLSLLSTVSKELTVYINETEGDVTNDELIAFINGMQGVPELFSGSPNVPVTPQNFAKESNVKISKDLVPTMNAALNIAKLTPAGAVANVLGSIVSSPDGVSTLFAGADAPALNPADPVTETKVSKSKLLDAMAQKISADKFSILQEMVKLGMLRTVIDSGTIETKLMFKTRHLDETSSSRKDRTRTRTNEKNKGRGKYNASNEIFSRAKGRNKNKTRALNVVTVKESDKTKNTTSTTVFGRVVINFSTDYLPVAQA